MYTPVDCALGSLDCNQLYYVMSPVLNCNRTMYNRCGYEATPLVTKHRPNRASYWLTLFPRLGKTVKPDHRVDHRPQSRSQTTEGGEGIEGLPVFYLSNSLVHLFWALLVHSKKPPPPPPPSPHNGGMLVSKHYLK